jgi:AcrR family transcriptional regulator
MDQSPKRRGRPREYDPELALAKARDTFWKAGYAATSLDELSHAMEMNRPSLYAAFGDKETLFLRALEGYVQLSRRALEAQLAAPLGLRACLTSVYANAIAFYLYGKGSGRGCFVLSTGPAEAANSPRVRKLMSRSFEDFDRAFAHRLRLAVERAELLPTADPTTLATIATALMHSIALRARAGATRASLEGMAAAGVELLCAAS